MFTAAAVQTERGADTDARSSVQLRGRVALDPQCPWLAVKIIRLAHPGFGLGQKLEHFPAYSSPAFVYVLGFS